MSNLSVNLLKSTPLNDSEGSDGLNSTQDLEDMDALQFAFIWYTYILLVTCVGTVVYVVVSWSVITKFRTVKNYVFLTASIANIIRIIVVAATILHRGVEVFYGDHVAIYFLFYSTMVHKYSLVVLCYLFYFDIVSVFHQEVKRKYLKVTIFAWGFPLMLLVISTTVVGLTFNFMDNLTRLFIETFVYMITVSCCNGMPALLTLLMMISCGWVLYFNLPVYTNSVPIPGRKRDTLRNFCWGSTIFVITNTTVLLLTLWQQFIAILAVELATSCAQIVVISLIIPFTTTNRALWREYYNSRTVSTSASP